MGASPSHYHINLRMDEAKRLLRETKKSVVKTALDVGYPNPSHFDNSSAGKPDSFRAITGSNGDADSFQREHAETQG